MSLSIKIIILNTPDIQDYFKLDWEYDVDFSKTCAAFKSHWNDDFFLTNAHKQHIEAAITVGPFGLHFIFGLYFFIFVTQWNKKLK